MRPLRYAINVTLDGCRDHRASQALRFGATLWRRTWRRLTSRCSRR